MVDKEPEYRRHYSIQILVSFMELVRETYSDYLYLGLIEYVSALVSGIMGSMSTNHSFLKLTQSEFISLLDLESLDSKELSDCSLKLPRPLQEVKSQSISPR